MNLCAIYVKYIIIQQKNMQLIKELCFIMTEYHNSELH